jgi:hypothetical protein
MLSAVVKQIADQIGNALRPEPLSLVCGRHRESDFDLTRIFSNEMGPDIPDYDT